MKVGNGQPVSDEKAKNIGGTTKRLLGFLKPYKKQVIIMLVLAALGTLFLIIGPKMLGEATNTIFSGVAST
ncbi:MAG: ABC transporter ATP-binding protein, partial [Christensenella sp.]